MDSVGSCMFVISWSPLSTGGVNEAVFGLATALRKQSTLRPIIAVTSWNPIELPNEVRGIPVIGLQLHDGYDNGTWTALKSAARLPADLIAIARVLKRHDVRIVNLHFPSLGHAAFVVLRRLGFYKGKVALSFHGSDVRGVATSGRKIFAAWRMFINGADEVFSVSNALAVELRKICPQRVAQVIHNGADLDMFVQTREARARGGAHILHIGKFEHNKAQEILLVAFKAVLERHPDVVLTMIGAAGPTLEATREAAAPFGDRVRLLVNVPHDQIPNYMKACDLFVLPSRAEGFPIVLIEAGATGLPVVSTKVGGIPEIITDGASGLLVEPDDPVALANAIVRLLESAALAHSLASALHAKALGYDWNRAVQQFIAALSRDS